MISILVNVFVWFVIIAGDRPAASMGMIWITGGIIMYAAYRKKNKMPVLAEVTIERVIEAAYQPLDFCDIIVPTTGGLDASMMQTACKIAQRDKSRILAVYIIEVPMTLPLNAKMAQEKEKGEKALDQAEMIAKEYGLKIETKILQSRSAGKTIVEEAKKRRADLILLGNTGKTKIEDALNGKTVNYVIKNAESRVFMDVAEK